MLKKILVKSMSDIAGVDKELNLFESNLFYAIAIGAFIAILLTN